MLRRPDDVRRVCLHLTVKRVDAANLEICIPRLLLCSPGPRFAQLQVNASAIALNNTEHGRLADAIAHPKPEHVAVVREALGNISDQELREHRLDLCRSHRLPLYVQRYCR